MGEPGRQYPDTMTYATLYEEPKIVKLRKCRILVVRGGGRQRWRSISKEYKVSVIFLNFIILLKNHGFHLLNYNSLLTDNLNSGILLIKS
jgi:hypothetical protein